MDLVAALSKNGIAAKLADLNKLRRRLLQESAEKPRPSTPTQPRVGEIPQAIARVLSEATEPVHISDIRHAVAHRLGHPVKTNSVKKALSEGTLLRKPRFQRTALGYYRLA